MMMLLFVALAAAVATIVVSVIALCRAAGPQSSAERQAEDARQMAAIAAERDSRRRQIDREIASNPDRYAARLLATAADRVFGANEPEDRP